MAVWRCPVEALSSDGVNGKVVTFELSDLLPTAMKAAGIEVDV